jgi:hypothetical protein
MDAEPIASACRLVRGIEIGGETLATAIFAQTGLSGELLKLKETRAVSTGAAPSFFCHRSERARLGVTRPRLRAGSRPSRRTGEDLPETISFRRCAAEVFV